MLKKLAAVAGATALAGTGIALAGATPAHAAGNPPGSIYLHGTAKQAKFWSRADCESHARWMVGQVNNSRTSTLLGGTQDAGFQGPELRFTCYPVRGAQWTYLTAYTSTSGAPIFASDLFVDTANRLPALINGTATVDTDNVWAFEHYVSVPSGSVSAATCNGWLNWFVNLAKTNVHTRMVGADTSCVDDGTTISYYVDYATTTATAFLRSDRPVADLPAAQPMLDALGYNDPMVQSIGNQKKMRQLSKAGKTANSFQNSWLVRK